VIDLFDATPWHANFQTAVAFSKSVRQVPAENERTQLCVQKELAEEKSQSLHSQKLQRWAQQIYVTKEKRRYSKSFVWRLEISPKYYDKIKSRDRPDPKSPARLITLHLVKSLILRVLLAWRHKNIFENQNAQRWIGKKDEVSPSTRKECPTKLGVIHLQCKCFALGWKHCCIVGLVKLK